MPVQTISDRHRLADNDRCSTLDPKDATPVGNHLPERSECHQNFVLYHIFSRSIDQIAHERFQNIFKTNYQQFC